MNKKKQSFTKENKKMITINKNTSKINGLGYSAYFKLIESRKQEKIEIIFTKGKLELLTEEIERINTYDYGLNIIKKDNTIIFVNLFNVTQII